MAGGAGAASGVAFTFWGFSLCVFPQAFCDAVLEVCEYLVGCLPAGMDGFPCLGLDVSEVNHNVAFDPLCSLSDICHCVDRFLKLRVLGRYSFAIGQGYLSVGMAVWGSFERRREVSEEFGEVLIFEGGV